ncbi:MAG: MgtC/SapB family protein, partial [Polyangiaceae bacterium]
MLIRLTVATVLGAIVGLERERTEHAAGLRTHALVSLGAALFMLVSSYGFDAVLGDHVTVDPSRVAAQVASGVGFLGAGTIILRREI